MRLTLRNEVTVEQLKIELQLMCAQLQACGVRRVSNANLYVTPTNQHGNMTLYGADGVPVEVVSINTTRSVRLIERAGEYQSARTYADGPSLFATPPRIQDPLADIFDLLDSDRHHGTTRFSSLILQMDDMSARGARAAQAAYIYKGGDIDAARRVMVSPNPSIAGGVPFDVALDSEDGLAEVLNLFGVT